MNPAETLRSFTIGAIEVSPQHNTLRLQDQCLTVQPKVMAVLYYLAQQQTRVVASEELLQAVWQGRVVTLASVQKSINALRAALCDLAGEHEFVAYFSKRGYQLVQPICWLESSNAQPPTSMAQAIISADTNRSEQTNPEDQTQPFTGSRNSVLAELRCLARQRAITPTQSQVGLALSLTLILALAIYGLILYSTAPNAKRPDTTTAQLSMAINKRPLPWQVISQYLSGETQAHHPTPSPDAKRTAYLRDSHLPASDSHSDLMVGDGKGTTWLLARSTSNWVDLAWSPSGRALAALEIYRADGLASVADYYQSPQYLYNIHLFTLDLKGAHLLEKNLLSQWQGQVYSISWRDENTLEFVATMGASTAKERYRYSITDQTLTSMAASTTQFQPHASRVREKITALISRGEAVSQVEFLDEHEQLISSHPIAADIHDLSWAADGSGVYALAPSDNYIYFFPLHGQGYSATLPPPLDKLPSGALSNLQIKGNGDSIYITASTLATQLQ